METPPLRKTYTSDPTDDQWNIICPFIPIHTSGRPRTTDMREVLNAIFYLLINGCGWRNLPHDFPPEGTVRDYFHQWRRTGLLNKIHDTLREKVRVQVVGRTPTPSAGNIDSQSVKSARTADIRCFDAGKKINDIQRHIVVDTLGLLLIVVVHAANIQDRDGAKWGFAKMGHSFSRLRLLWADGGYVGKLIDYVYDWYLFVLQVVKRSDGQQGFKVLPRRWVGERTLGWLMNDRRLCRNYECWQETSEAVVKRAMIHFMIRRLA